MLASESPVLELDRVTVVRDDAVVLDEISLTVARGEFVAVLGPNGSGKSSLLKLLTRELYVHPRSGGCRVLGQSRWNVRQLRGQLGIVSNDLQHRMPPELTAHEAVRAGFTGHLGGYEGSTAESLVATTSALSAANIAHLAERRIGTLSSGEARRVLLARALVHRPHTLVLDEPTTSLDLAAAYGFMRTVAELSRTGCGIVLVTHHFDELIPEVSRIVLLSRGRVLADAAPPAVLQPQIISAAFGIPVTIEGDGPYRVTAAQ